MVERTGCRLSIRRQCELLGVNRNTLRKKIRDLDIQVVRGAR